MGGTFWEGRLSPHAHSRVHCACAAANVGPTLRLGGREARRHEFQGAVIDSRCGLGIFCFSVAAQFRRVTRAAQVNDPPVREGHAQPVKVTYGLKSGFGQRAKLLIQNFRAALQPGKKRIPPSAVCR